MNTFLLLASKCNPGAVPLVFINFLNPSGINACLMFVSGIIKPLDFHLSSIQDTCLLSRINSRFKYFEITSFVISSSVGPKPPHIIITSFLLSTYLNPSVISTSSSETVNSVLRVNPELYKIFPKLDKFVLRVSPNNISVPTVNNPIFIILD